MPTVHQPRSRLLVPFFHLTNVVCQNIAVTRGGSNGKGGCGGKRERSAPRPETCHKAVHPQYSSVLRFRWPASHAICINLLEAKSRKGWRSVDRVRYLSAKCGSDNPGSAARWRNRRRAAWKSCSAGGNRD